MPRIRSIKPTFFDNPDIGNLTPTTALVFIGLWTQADREGRLAYEPRRLQVRISPYWPIDVSEAITELDAAGFIRIYQAAGIGKCISVNNFIKHQKPHPNEPASSIPAPVDQKHKRSRKLARTSDNGTRTSDNGTRTRVVSCLLSLGTGSLSSVSGSLSLDNGSLSSVVPSSGKNTRPLTALADPAFQSFWSAYPRKTAKQTALKAWTRLQPDAALCARIMAAIEQQAPHWTDPQYIPHPATWLNAGRWQDEILPPSPFGHSKVAHGNQLALKQALDEHYAAQNTIQHEDTTHDRDGFPAIRRRIDDSR